MTPQTIRYVLAGLLLLAVGLTPFLAQGNQQRQKTIASNAQAIAAMSTTQRERLNQNFSDYLKLSPTEQHKLQQFHLQIVQDTHQNAGELATVLRTYDNWLKTLSPHQRDELMKTTDPKSRIKMIQELINRQREEAVRRGMPPLMMRGDRRSDLPTLIDDATRVAIFTALEQRAAERLTASQMEEIRSLTGFKRELRLLQLLKEFGTGVNPQPLLENPPVEFTQVAKEIANYTKDEKLIRYVQSGPPIEPPEGKWLGSEDARRLVSVIMQAVSVELFKLRFEVQQNVDSAKLSEYLDSLSRDEQMELLSLDASDFVTDLKKQYVDAKEEATDLPRLSQLNELFISRSFWRFRFGDGRSWGGRPPRRPDGRPPMNEGGGPGPPPNFRRPPGENREPPYPRPSSPPGDAPGSALSR